MGSKQPLGITDENIHRFILYGSYKISFLVVGYEILVVKINVLS